MDPVIFLTHIAVILLLGVLASALASRLLFPDVLLFVLIGAGLGSILYNGVPLIEFPSMFIASISLLALAMLVFESTVKIKLKHFDTLSLKTMRLVLFVTPFEVVLPAAAVYIVFPDVAMPMAILFASMMVGTDPSVILPLLRGAKSKVVDILKLEAILNTPFTVLLPFLIFDLVQSVEKIPLAATFIDQIGPFLAKFVSGLGAGLLIGLILFKVLRRAYSKMYSPLAIVLGALLAYVLAEGLGGNGVLSVTTLGLFVGNISFREKMDLLTLESVLARALYILVFVLIGSIIKVPFTSEFLLKSFVVFLAYLAARYFAVALCLRRDGLSERNKWFMALVSPKGIAVVVVAIVFSGYNLPELKIVLDMAFMFVVYSIVVSSVTAWGQKYFL